MTPDEILTFIISNSEKFETKKGLKALYCAGADRDAVREAGNKLGITVEDVSAALEESIAECGDKKSLSDRDFLGEGPENISGLSDREPEPQPASEPQSAPEQIDDEPEGVTLSEQVAPPEKALPASPSAP